MSDDKNGSYPSGNHAGYGRLWERFQVQDINDRLENLYVHLRDVVKEYGSEPPDYSETVNEIKKIFKDHLLKVNAFSFNWEQILNEKTAQINALKDETKVLKLAKTNDEQMNILNEGINAYIEKCTCSLREALEVAVREKNEAMSQLKEEREKHKQSKEKIKEFKAKSDALIDVIRGMRNNDKYNIEHVNAQIIAERDELQKKYNKLTVKHQQKSFELDEICGAKLKQICDEIMATEPFDATKAQLLWKKDLDELSQIYAEKLKKKELEWQRAKNQSIKTLDSEYQHLEDRISASLELRIKECKELKMQITENRNKYKQDLQNKQLQIAQMNAKVNQMENEQNVIREALDMKQKDLIRKESVNMSLQTQLSQYKILWQHFFGLDAPLKDQIESVNANLSRFERRHNIVCSAPRKKRKVVVSSLSEWFMDNQYGPLMIDDMPIPNGKDKYRRFHLFNYSNNAIKLKGFSFENQDGHSFAMDEREISPKGSIVIALNAAKRESDIVFPDDFHFDFAEKQKLFLCDSHNGKHQIFPAVNDVYTSLDKWDESPLKAIPFGGLNDKVKGFILQNVSGKDICLINHHLANRQGTFQVAVPENRMKASDFFRLIIVCDDDASSVVLQTNDILIESDVVRGGEDALLLRDEYNGEFELYELNGFGGSGDHNLNGSKDVKTRCFIM